MNLTTLISHMTPLQQVQLLLSVLLVLIGLLRWTSQRGKPRPVRTYRQGCVIGLLFGLVIGVWVGFTIGSFTGFFQGISSFSPR